MYARGRPKSRYQREVLMRIKDRETIREARLAAGYKYTSAHTAASSLWTSLGLVIPVLNDEAAPNRQADSERAVEDFRTFKAEYAVIVAD